jgi:mannosyltransferase OCH1-like enzyme
LNFLWGYHEGGGDHLTAEAEDVVSKWRDLNAGWPCIVTRPEETEILADAGGHPYHEYPYWTQRCDVGRALVMQRDGGVYSDTDVVPHRPIGSLLDRYPHAGVLLAVEVWVGLRFSKDVARRHPIRGGRPEAPRRVAYHFLASVPGHPFWQEVLALMKQRARLPIREEYDVLYTTGPDVVTEAARRTRHADVVVVGKRRADRYLTHLGSGSWRPEVRRRTGGG